MKKVIGLLLVIGMLSINGAVSAADKEMEMMKYKMDIMEKMYKKWEDAKNADAIKEMVDNDMMMYDAYYKAHQKAYDMAKGMVDKKKMVEKFKKEMGDYKKEYEKKDKEYKEKMKKEEEEKKAEPAKKDKEADKKEEDKK